jgi:hypothetical protein
LFRRQRGSRQAGRIYSGGREGAGRKAGRKAGGREGSRQASMHALRKRRRGSRQEGRQVLCRRQRGEQASRHVCFTQAAEREQAGRQALSRRQRASSGRLASDSSQTGSRQLMRLTKGKAGSWHPGKNIDGRQECVGMVAGRLPEAGRLPAGRCPPRQARLRQEQTMPSQMCCPFISSGRGCSVTQWFLDQGFPLGDRRSSGT